MADNPENSFKFWHELKRRKVVQVVIGYAAAAYVILELISIIAEPFRLPEWTIRFVFILLCIGFIIAIFLSWIYDLTPEGIKKTESLKVVKMKVEPAKPLKWKLKASEIIIAVLIVIVIIMAYPRVFKEGIDIKANASTVTFINDLGKEETREVFDEAAVYKVLLFPFVSEKSDTNNLWLGYGVLEGIYHDLSQFPYMLVYKDVGAVHPQEQVNSAKGKNCPYYLTGTYEVLDGNYNITYKLHQTVNGNVIREKLYSNDDLFGILDSISLRARIDIGVTDKLINSTDIQTRVHITNDIDAYKYFIYGTASEFLHKGDKFVNWDIALDLDPAFALTSYYAAKRNITYQLSSVRTQDYIEHAMKNKGKFPEYQEIRTRILNYYIVEDREKTIELTNRLNLLYPDNIDVLNSLIEVYYNNAMYVEAHKYIERLNEIVPDDPFYQNMLARNFLYSNELNKGLRYIKQRIKEKPDHTDFLLRKAQIHLHRNEWDEAEDELNNAIFHSQENKEKWSPLFDHIQFMKENSYKSINLESFVGRYRGDESEYCWDKFIINNHLYEKAPNQEGSFSYPISDSSFVSLEGFQSNSILLRDTHRFNDEGEVYFLVSEQSNREAPYLYWKQDSLILQAEKLLETNRIQESLVTFQKAYAENPEHHYLANYIKHLKFIQSQEYEDSKSLLDSYLGNYDVGSMDQVEIYKKNGEFYLADNYARKYKLLPISKDQFMTPFLYMFIIEIINEDNILGLKAVLVNGSQTGVAHKIN